MQICMHVNVQTYIIMHKNMQNATVLCCTVNITGTSIHFHILMYVRTLFIA